jgi:hypothetical protein
VKWLPARMTVSDDRPKCNGHPADTQLDAAIDAEIGHLADGGRYAWETYRCVEGHWHARPVPHV